MASPAMTTGEDYSEDDPTAYGRLAVLAQMGWTVESVVEPPLEQVTDPLPAEETPGEVATLPPGENAAVERETPTWLEMPKKQNKGVLLAVIEPWSP